MLVCPTDRPPAGLVLHRWLPIPRSSRSFLRRFGSPLRQQEQNLPLMGKRCRGCGSLRDGGALAGGTREFAGLAQKLDLPVS